jgi:hypothetical protein
MREHQIIINLKPEHYQELERLSRASGARSVSVFVKERMLASLGIGGSANVANAPGSLNIAAVTSDIRRLHRDLQVFVAESLSGKDFGYAAGPNEREGLTPGAELARAVAEGDATQSVASTTQASAENHHAPDLEAVVSIEHLAPLGNPPSGATQAGSLSSIAPTGIQETAQAVPSNQAIPRQQLEFPLRPRGAGAAFGNIIPGLASFKSSDTSNSEEPEVHTSMSATETSPSPSPSPSPNGAIFALPVVSQSNIVQPPVEVPDDLEELAERAFAISPRLGAMDEVDDDTPMFSDPLDELLGEIEDEGAQQRQALADLSVTAPANSSPQESQYMEDNVAGNFEDLEAGEPLEAERARNADEGVDLVEDGALVGEEHAAGTSTGEIEEGGSTENTAGNDSRLTETEGGSQDEEITNQSGTTTGSSQNPPPISGGPPPRRRRT